MFVPRAPRGRVARERPSRVAERMVTRMVTRVAARAFGARDLAGQVDRR